MGNKPLENLSHTQYSLANKQNQTTVEQLNYLTSRPEWKIDFKEYTDRKWKRILPLIKKTDITQIQFQQISTPHLLSTFVHIEFHLLTRIELKNVHLYSIEQMAFINAPLLTSLEFNTNRIVGIRPLRKLHAPNLKVLEFYENRVNQADCLSECNFAAQMDKIVMFSPTHQRLPQNYNWLFKVKAAKLKLFEYYSRRVINNEGLKRMARQRFGGVQLTFRYDRVQ